MNKWFSVFEHMSEDNSVSDGEIITKRNIKKFVNLIFIVASILSIV